MKRFLISASVAMVISSLAYAPVAQAEVITTNGSVKFQGNGFESDTVGTAPSVTTAGSWFVTSPEGDDVTVKAGGSGGVPAAAQGSNLLNLSKPVNPVGQGGHQAVAEAVMSSAATSGQSVRANFSIYVDSAGNTQTGGDGLHAMANFVNSSADTGDFGNRVTWFGFAFQGGDVADLLSSTGIGDHDMFVAAYNGSYQNVTRADTGANMYLSPDTWHFVQLDYTVGSSYTATIDGVTSNSIALESGLASTNPIGLTFRTNVNNRASTFYVDAVPEPGTMALLVTGLIGLLAYAWRKRR